METSNNVIFRNMDESDSVRDKALESAAKLHRYFDKIENCQIMIEAPHRHQTKGRLYHVRIELTVPEAELVASREPWEDHAHENVYVALRDAFRAIRRQLKEYVARRRNRHSKHRNGEILIYGNVQSIDLQDLMGYIESDGHRVRFTSDALVDFDFKELEVGDRVRFAEMKLNQEMIATRVYIEDEHREM